MKLLPSTVATLSIQARLTQSAHLHPHSVARVPAASSHSNIEKILLAAARSAPSLTKCMSAVMHGLVSQKGTNVTAVLLLLIRSAHGHWKYFAADDLGFTAVVPTRAPSDKGSNPRVHPIALSGLSYTRQRLISVMDARSTMMHSPTTVVNHKHSRGRLSPG